MSATSWLRCPQMRSRSATRSETQWPQAAPAATVRLFALSAAHIALVSRCAVRVWWWARRGALPADLSAVGCPSVFCSATFVMSWLRAAGSGCATPPRGVGVLVPANGLVGPNARSEPRPLRLLRVTNNSLLVYVQAKQSAFCGVVHTRESRIGVGVGRPGTKVNGTPPCSSVT